MAASLRSVSRLLNGGLNIISKNNNSKLVLNTVCINNNSSIISSIKSTSTPSLYRLYSSDSNKPKHNDHHGDHHHGAVDPKDPFSGDGVYDDHHHEVDETQPSEWLLENPDTNILRYDHPGFPYSKLRDETLPVFTLEVIAKHNKRDDCWLLINGKVYNVSSFIEEHPGGDIILAGAGKDCTTMFELSGMGSDVYLQMKDYHIGYCDHIRRYDGFTKSNRTGTHYLNNFEV
ncbi:cytochrome b5 domain-containing protein [Cavenderia fasciculata]|uniref:Cytochrome b5 domain-containing protein n=1 Tax=Cavenderia fasciculata TaxID=261658 RepID=F4QAG4_CACFS|nr:cytochrome b5 domain-containing protein [Cavenderia fasciculata]EGG15683.1 cytochrome b5 domain-containing protein [Cavenderia fasciculata]|eukprot:XP_004354425.1 cytochrome b5 domain-containing protein [Cavenderia fasciculata]